MVMTLAWKNNKSSGPLRKILKDPNEKRLDGKIKRLESRGWEQIGIIHEYRFVFHTVMIFKRQE